MACKNAKCVRGMSFVGAHADGRHCWACNSQYVDDKSIDIPIYLDGDADWPGWEDFCRGTTGPERRQFKELLENKAFRGDGGSTMSRLGVEAVAELRLQMQDIVDEREGRIETLTKVLHDRNGEIERLKGDVGFLKDSLAAVKSKARVKTNPKTRRKKAKS